MELNVGGIFECPKGHTGKIVWLSEDKKVVAVACSHEHVRKTVNANLEPGERYSVRGQPREKREIYVKNTVFIIQT